MSDLSDERRRTSSWWKRCPSPIKKVMFAGDVGPRSRTLSPSSRASHFINSLKPVERRCTRSPDTTPSAESDWPEPPNILLNMLGDTTHHCKGRATQAPISGEWPKDVLHARAAAFRTKGPIESKKKRDAEG